MKSEGYNAKKTFPPAASSPDGSPTPLPKKEKFQVTMVDVQDIAEDTIRDKAERTLTESKEAMQGVGGFFKKIWKHGIAREYYRQKEIIRARETMREHGGIYATEEDPRIEKTAHDEAMAAIMERFASDHEETIHEGETRSTIDKKGDENERKVHEGVSALIREYATGTLTDENFKEARTRLLQQVSESRKDADKNAMYADNLIEVARQVRLAVAHGTALEDLDLELDIKLGAAKSAIRTKANYNAADRVIEAIKKTPVGRFVNEGTLASGVAIAMSVGSWIGRRSLSSNLAKAVTFGGTALAAGVFTGLAESKRIKEDRRQHAREMAQGRTYEKGKSPRREEMDKYLYEMESASELSTGLQSRFFVEKKGGELIERTLTAEERDEAIAYLADIEARIALNEREAVDLVSYSSPTAIERERTDLDMLRWKAKAQLRKSFEKEPHASGKDLNALLKLSKDVQMELLTKGAEGIEERNKRFDKMKTGRVARAAAIGVVGGAGIGLAVQEVGAFFDPHQVGAIERLVRGDHAFPVGERHLGATPVEAFRNLIERHLPQAHTAMHTVEVGPNGHLRLPEGMTLDGQGNEYTLRDGDRVLAEGLSVTNDGGLDEESIAQLEHYGLIVSSATENVNNSVTTNVAAAEYLRLHPELGERIHRTLWFDNDTPAPVFDRNELRLWWGGEHNTGIDANNQYSFSMDHMTRGGSFHHGLNADAQRLLAEGKLRILLSVSQDSQFTPIEVPIQPDGSVRIDPNSEAGRLLFRTGPDGHAQFLGRFAEVAEVTGQAEDGADNVRILATYEGEGVDTIPSTIVTSVPETTTIINAPHDYHIDPPPIIPPWGRRPLESLRNPESDEGPPPLVPAPLLAGYGYYGAASVEQAKQEMEEAHIALDTYKRGKNKREWLDKDGKLVERNVERERAHIREYLDRQDVAYKTELEEFSTLVGPMSEKCRVAVIIPARFEEVNLENLLDQYALQVGPDNRLIDPELFELNILVNRKQGEAEDKSMQVIEAWKKKHPEYRVNAVDVVFPPEKANVGMARKYITDLVLKRSLDRGRADGPLYIESEDADLVSMDRRTISRLVEKFDERPYVDILRGVQDRQPEIMQKNDLLFFERRFHDMIEIFMRREAYRPENLRGSNFVWNRIISGGWNTAYTAEAYAQIGGYVSDVVAEDMKIGWKVSLLRGDVDENGEPLPNTKTVETSGLRASSSPRRYLDAMNKQEGPYDNFQDQALKHKTLDELLEGVKEFEHAKPEHRQAYEDSINRGFIFFRDQLTPEVGRAVFERTLINLGLRPKTDFTYREDGTVVFTDSTMPRIAEMMTKYKEEKRHLLGDKRQNSKLKKSKIRMTAGSKPTEEKEKPKKPVLRVRAAAGPGQKPTITVRAPRNEQELEEQRKLQRRIAQGG